MHKQYCEGKNEQKNVLSIANDTKILMDDIENVIKKLKRMIADCKDRISSLRSELSSLED